MAVLHFGHRNPGTLGRDLQRSAVRVWAVAVVVLAAVACAERAAVDPAHTMAPSTTATSAGTTTTAVRQTSTTATTAPTATTGTPASPVTTSPVASEPRPDDAPAGPVVTTSQPRQVSHDRPLRVWVIGDSLAGPLGVAFGELVEGPVVVAVEHTAGSGLANPEWFDWPGTITTRLAAAAPDVVIFHVGANDAQALRSEGIWAPFGTAEWSAGYRDIVGSVMDRIGEVASRLYWVGAPVMEKSAYSDAMAVVNEAFRREASTRQRVRYVDAFALFGDDDGGFSAELPGADGAQVVVRQADGVHYTAAGAQMLARHVLAIIAQEWDLTGAGPPDP